MTDTAILLQIKRLLPRAVCEIPATMPTFYLIIRIAGLFAAFIFVDYFMQRAGRISASSYEQPYLFIGLLDRLGIPLITGLAILTFFLFRYGDLLAPWRALKFGIQLRWFVVFLAIIMAWSFTTFGFNYYYAQGYYLDRILIATLAGLIWFRPVFIFPFLLLIFPVFWQIDLPQLGSGAVIAHKLQVLHVLNMFAAAFLIYAVTGSRRTDEFFFLSCCLVVSAYWVPAFTKLELEWLSNGRVFLMPLAAYTHGWLNFLAESDIVTFAKTISWLNFPMLFFVLTAEAACLIFFLHRYLAIGLLAALSLFHLGVFVLYGYLFWTWIFLNVALLIILYTDRKVRKLDIFRPVHLLIGVLLIGTASLWAKPSPLGWIDTNLTYTYRYDVIGESGKKYTLSPRFFEPYGDVFTMGGFSYLDQDHGFLVGPYGITRSHEIADSLMNAKSAADVLSLEQTLGKWTYKPEKSAVFYAFVRRYFENWNNLGNRASVLQSLGPPPQFWSFNRANPFDRNEKIRVVIVSQVTTLFTGERLQVIRDRVLQRLEIASTQRE